MWIHVSVVTFVCMCVLMHVEVGIQPLVMILRCYLVPWNSLPFSRSSPCSLGWLAGSARLLSDIFCIPNAWSICASYHEEPFMWAWESELSYPCLCGKHVTKWTISSAWKVCLKIKKQNSKELYWEARFLNFDLQYHKSNPKRHINCLVMSADSF